ncbi:MAG: TlpA family protein disulfide reductase [Planctomycetaceae bacterium]|nr:TlpA family protein disulfide reductase [Planctomycetaceae bacterium]
MRESPDGAGGPIRSPALPDRDRGRRLSRLSWLWVAVAAALAFWIGGPEPPLLETAESVPAPKLEARVLGEGHLSLEDLRGKVVVVFSWNMQAQWAKWFFERLRRLHDDYAPRGVVVVGISRLHRFDPVRMEVDESMSEEAELMFYDAWTREYGVDHPLAVGDRDGILMAAWAARVVPMFVVVGKDGNVAYVRTGKEEEHFGILREVLDRELAR